MPSNEYPGQIYPVADYSAASTGAPVETVWYYASAGGMSAAAPPAVTTVGTYEYPTTDVFYLPTDGNW